MASEDDVRPIPIVVYDANILYPFHLRNLFVQLAVDYVVSPRRTDAIHDEWMRNLAAAGRVSADRLKMTGDIMRRVLPDATVADFEHRIPALLLPDPNDRHVLAAAIEAGAEAIITFNLRHFPSGVLDRFGLVALHPDAFLCRLHDDDPELVAAVVEAARGNLTVTTPDAASCLGRLERQGLVDFVARLRLVAET